MNHCQAGFLELAHRPAEAPYRDDHDQQAEADTGDCGEDEIISGPDRGIVGVDPCCLIAGLEVRSK